MRANRRSSSPRSRPPRRWRHRIRRAQPAPARVRSRRRSSSRAPPRDQEDGNPQKRQTETDHPVPWIAGERGAHDREAEADESQRGQRVPGHRRALAAPEHGRSRGAFGQLRAQRFVKRDGRELPELRVVACGRAECAGELRAAFVRDARGGLVQRREVRVGQRPERARQAAVDLRLGQRALELGERAARAAGTRRAETPG